MPIALHGGGEFLSGDEPFLDALLETTRRAAAGRRGDISGLIRVVLVPTAAARGRPDLAGSNGVEAVRRRGLTVGLPIWADVAPIVDEASADDPALAELVAAADLVYLPGGDPDLIPALLRESAAGRALRDAHDAGGVLAGASAGAMGLADWTWTTAGGVRGLGFVPGVAVFPHYEESRRRSWQANLETIAPAGLGYLGLDERTGVISDRDEWVVAGEGSAYWFAPGMADPLVVASGDRVRL
ncbi:MAG TPA: Type 1 glutamine amidotransferase-like domain-containing protein [Candidatus Limnocylindrales bacterium]|nr:Type 1 glutamine amidotransferase-like domain-containing protein [Candidatus Limnocylindrales bacterium]